MPRDDEFFAKVAGELAKGSVDPAAWARAFSKSLGNESVAKSLYIGFRVEQLKELALAEEEEVRRQDAYRSQLNQANEAVRKEWDQRRLR